MQNGAGNDKPGAAAGMPRRFAGLALVGPTLARPRSDQPCGCAVGAGRNRRVGQRGVPVTRSGRRRVSIVSGRRSRRGMLLAPVSSHPAQRPTLPSARRHRLRQPGLGQAEPLLRLCRAGRRRVPRLYWCLDAHCSSCPSALIVLPD